MTTLYDIKKVLDDDLSEIFSSAAKILRSVYDATAYMFCCVVWVVPWFGGAE